MVKLCAFVFAGALVFPFALIVLVGMATLLLSVFGVTVAENLQVIVLAAFVFAAAAIANVAYRGMLQRMAKEGRDGVARKGRALS